MVLAFDLFTTLANYDALIGIGVSWAVAAWIYLGMRRDWTSKSFINQVNFSLNAVAEGSLQLRTLFEADSQAVMGHRSAVARLKGACRKTTPEMPFVALDDDDDWGYLMRAALNVMSEMCGSVYLARAVGAPVATGEFVFGITFEAYGEMKTRKVRVIVIERGQLERHFSPEVAAAADQLQLASPHHSCRIATLKTMGRLWASSDPKQRRMLSTVELGVVSQAPTADAAPPAAAPAAPAPPAGAEPTA